MTTDTTYGIIGDKVGDCTSAPNSIIREIHDTGEFFTQTFSNYSMSTDVTVGDLHFDLKITKYLGPQVKICATKEYYFDRVNLPTYLLSPEIMDIIINRAFASIGKDPKDVKLKTKYQLHPYLSPKSNPHLDKDLCIPLTSELLACCIKHAVGTVNYAPLGNSDYESLAQQIENYIHTGRADRVTGPGPTGPNKEHNVHLILKENNKAIAHRRVFMGSFAKNGDVTHCVSQPPKWVHMVVD